MPIQLTDSERARLGRMVRRPRSRKQLHRARALLALDEGHPIDTVARMFRVGVDRVEQWAERFEKLRLGFLVEPTAGRPKADPGGGDLDPGEDD